MNKIIALFIFGLVLTSCSSDDKEKAPNFVPGPTNDTLPLLRSKTWHLVNPIQNHSTFVFGPCEGFVTESYRLEGATLQFSLDAEGKTTAIETRAGICQSYCGYTLYYEPCSIVYEGEDGGGSNSFESITVSRKNINFVSNETLSGSLPWLIVSAKIVSLSNSRLIIENQYYDEQLIFE